MKGSNFVFIVLLFGCSGMQTSDCVSGDCKNSYGTSDFRGYKVCRELERREVPR